MKFKSSHSAKLSSAILEHRAFGKVLAIATATVTFAAFGFIDTAGASQPTIGLAAANSFAISAGTTVTNTGTSIIHGSVGVSPGSAATGFPPAIILQGTLHTADAVAANAAASVTAAYLDAAGRTPITVAPADLANQELVPGVYDNATALALSGNVTLNAHGNANANFIFQSGSSLTTSSASRVLLIGGAQACHVFWQVTSSATLGTGSVFVGTILALTSISAKTGANVTGRLLARNGQVSLESNVITRPACSSETIPTGSPGTGFGGMAQGVGHEGWLVGSLLLGIGTAAFSAAAILTRSRRRLVAQESTLRQLP